MLMSLSKLFDFFGPTIGLIILLRWPSPGWFIFSLVSTVFPILLGYSVCQLKQNRPSTQAQRDFYGKRKDQIGLALSIFGTLCVGWTFVPADWFWKTSSWMKLGFDSIIFDQCLYFEHRMNCEISDWLQNMSELHGPKEWVWRNFIFNLITIWLVTAFSNRLFSFVGQHARFVRIKSRFKVKNRKQHKKLLQSFIIIFIMGICLSYVIVFSSIFGIVELQGRGRFANFDTSLLHSWFWSLVLFPWLYFQRMIAILLINIRNSNYYGRKDYREL